jgi:hypothetical protein
MTSGELKTKISNLPNRAPITAKLTSLLRNLGTKGPADAGHSDRKKQWLRWLDGYNGPGHYRRKDWNRTAGFVYNHLLSPVMVLWLGEASGVPGTEVRRATMAALAAQRNLATQSAAIRKIIPWKMIEDRLGAPSEKASREQS